MQPCNVCGGTEIEPGGFCATCRSFRGIQDYDPNAPNYPYAPSAQGGQPVSALYGQQPSGPPYGQQPSGPPPADQQQYGQPADPYGQTSAPPNPYGQHSAPPGPYGQTSGPPNPYGQQSAPPNPYGQPSGPPHQGFAPGDPYGPPGGSAPPFNARPQRSRSALMVPLIALSVVAVILVLGIVGVVLIRAGDDGTDDPTPLAADVDKCVVGTWRVTESREKVELEEGLVEFVGSGATVRLEADGTGEQNFGSGTTYRATVSGQPVTIVFTGKITFNFKTVDGSMTFSNVKPEGTATVTVSGTQTTSEPISSDATPTSYTCSGNSLTQQTELATTKLRKS